MSDTIQHISTLPDRWQKFIEIYVKNNRNATGAAKQAGFAKSSAGLTARNLLKKPVIQYWIEKLQERPPETLDDFSDTSVTILNIQRELWTNHKLAKDNKRFADSNKALELLGKTIGAFTDNLDVNNQGSILDDLKEIEKRRNARRKQELLKNSEDSEKVVELTTPTRAVRG